MANSLDNFNSRKFPLPHSNLLTLSSIVYICRTNRKIKKVIEERKPEGSVGPYQAMKRMCNCRSGRRQHKGKKKYFKK